MTRYFPVTGDLWFLRVIKVEYYFMRQFCGGSCHAGPEGGSSFSGCRMRLLFSSCGTSDISRIEKGFTSGETAKKLSRSWKKNRTNSIAKPQFRSAYSDLLKDDCSVDCTPRVPDREFRGILPDIPCVCELVPDSLLPDVS